MVDDAIVGKMGIQNTTPPKIIDHVTPPVIDTLLTSKMRHNTRHKYCILEFTNAPR